MAEEERADNEERKKNGNGAVEEHVKDAEEDAKRAVNAENAEERAKEEIKDITFYFQSCFRLPSSLIHLYAQ